jgi:hypothetical protein
VPESVYTGCDKLRGIKLLNLVTIMMPPKYTLLISPWLKKMLGTSEERLNTPFIVIHAIFRSLIIK